MSSISNIFNKTVVIYNIKKSESESFITLTSQGHAASGVSPLIAKGALPDKPLYYPNSAIFPLLFSMIPRLKGDLSSIQ